MITWGSLINSNAIEVLFLYPPEIPLRSVPPTNVSMHLSNFKFFTISSILCFLSIKGMFKVSPPTYSKVYLTVKLCNKISSCIT